MKKRLGSQEVLLLAYTQLKNIRTVSIADLTEPLNVSKNQAQELLKRMARSKLITRVRPGLYLVPPKLPLGGTWSPSESLAINTLIQDRNGKYQVCGPNAFNLYGFDNQIPNRIYVYNNCISGKRKIGSVALTLIKVSNARLGNTVKISSDENDSYMLYSSRTRTLVDAVYDWARFNCLPQAYDWIRNDLISGKTKSEELVKLTLKYGNQAVIRRIGVLLEQQKISETLLQKLERALNKSSSLIPWIPDKPKQGPGIKRWGVVLNE
jgi:predicted transcriptional regulator of viral defense system